MEDVIDLVFHLIADTLAQSYDDLLVREGALRVWNLYCEGVVPQLVFVDG